MYHSFDHTISKTSSGMARKKLSSAIWLRCARMACRLASSHGVTSTSVEMRMAGSPIVSIPSAISSDGAHSESAASLRRERR